MNDVGPGNHPLVFAVNVLSTCGVPVIEGFGDAVNREATLTSETSVVTVEGS
ncbi:unannotated protein [freshwater metagenome]|uniref:Unannotated protein n=1 Tax=freshwater metagenome TaxID=449393 RepID=A0A6J7DPJ7_9ZZZZ